MEFCDVLIVGGGAAGMACACTLTEQGKRVILAERESSLGGVLKQCVHSGFGRTYFGEEMTGIRYAESFIRRLDQLSKEAGSSLRIFTDTMVLRIHPDRTALLSSCEGLQTVCFRKLIFATGCREQTIYSRLAAGSRPAGIMTCGMVQRMMNLSGYSVKGPVVILGTGDIGQIVARQLIQSGVQVLCMIEQKERPGGRRQNREQCIEAYHIPVLLNSTIVRILGDTRIQAVVVRNLKTGEEQRIACQMLLTAIGLSPETELAEDLCFQIGMEQKGESGRLPDWAFRAGNCRMVHDIVDSVTIEAEQLSASLFPASESDPSCGAPAPGNG